MSRLGPRVRLVLAALLLVGVFVVRYQTVRMDWVFFQPSWSGVRGLVLYLVGDYGRAARAYRAHFAERAASGGSGDPMFAALLVGNLDEAERLAKASLSARWSEHAALTLGEAALDRGRAAEALALFRSVLDRRPDHVDALLLTSVAQTRGGDPGRAIDALNRALLQGVGARLTGFLRILEATGDLERLPRGERPLCLLAHDYRYLRVYDPSNARWAVKRAREAIAAGDRPAEAYLTIGVVHDKQGQPDDAIRAFTEASRHDPRLAQAHWSVARVSAERGDLATARRMVLATFDAAPTDPIYLDEVHRILAERLGDLPADVAVMERAVALSPDGVKAHRHLAYSTAVLGQEERALTHYRRAVELDPKDPTNWEGLGWTLGRLKRHEDSVAAYRRASTLAPYRYEPHEALGQFYSHKRRYREAIEEYETALTLGAPSIDTMVSLCIARFNVSEFGAAEGCFREVLVREPKNMQALRYFPQSHRNASLERERR